MKLIYPLKIEFKITSEQAQDAYVEWKDQYRIDEPVPFRHVIVAVKATITIVNIFGIAERVENGELINIEDYVGKGSFILDQYEWLNNKGKNE